MPPDVLVWLIGTLAVATMGGVSAISVALIRRSANGLVTRRDFEEFRIEARKDMVEVKANINRLSDKLDTHISYSHSTY